MKTTAYDAIVIGAGQAGPPLAVRLAKSGLRTLLVEREHLGGTCVNDGCIPTKTLVASARAAHVARRAADWGVDVGGPVRVDMRAVKERKDRVVAQSIENLRKWVAGTERLTLVWGAARFTAPHAIEVNGETMEAPKIFINVGGRPTLPPWPGIADVPVLTNVSMMAVDTLPEHLIVAGGSYIGLEFAQMYRRFGARVTVVEMGPRLIGREDEDISQAVREILEGEGIAVRADAKCIGLEPHAEGVAVSVDCREGEPKVVASHVLWAAGRVPNTDDLGLAAAGIETDKRGYIRVGDDLQTSVAGVYALGDCNGRGAFTHTAWNDYEIVRDNLLHGASRKVTDRIPIYALYTDPPLGRIGASLAEAKRSGAALLCATYPMKRVSRAVERGETLGFMKAVVDADTRRLLGAAILGASGDEVVQTLVEAMYARLTVDDIMRGVRIHPTVAELVPTLLGELTPVTSAPR